MKPEDIMSVKWKREWGNEWKKTCEIIKNSGLDLNKIKLTTEEGSRK